MNLKHKFIVCTILVHSVVLGLGFAHNFRVGIDWNNQCQLYLHQHHKPLPYSKAGPSKDSVIFSVECNEYRLESETNIILTPHTIAVVVIKGTNNPNTSGTKDTFVNLIANPFCIYRAFYIGYTQCVYVQKRRWINTAVMVNIGTEEVKIIKGLTLAYLAASTVWQSFRCLREQSREWNCKYFCCNSDQSWNITSYFQESSKMIFPGDYTPVRKVLLQGAKILVEMQEQLNGLIHAFEDIMSSS